MSPVSRRVEQSSFTLFGPRFSQSLERGLAILSSYRSESPVRGIAQIANELGLSRSTAHRYVSTLAALGYLEQVANRKYVLGRRVSDVGMSALSATGLATLARPHLEELRRKLSYGVGLAVLDDSEIVYVERVRSYTRGGLEIALGMQPGSRLPAHATAIGKLLLAYLPDEDRAARVRELRLSPCTPATIVDRDRLRRELDRIRAARVAVEDREHTPDQVAVAVPVLLADDAPPLAAIGVTLPADAIPPRELSKRLAPELQAAAERLSRELLPESSSSRSNGRAKASSRGESSSRGKASSRGESSSRGKPRSKAQPA
ncbi:MAG TPA: IclR family transcriptional regulator [Solirubrobacteraceae bacterium]|nr:IclR family transcriptional regulator [Solirubrobacteraceae bacterium]